MSKFFLLLIFWLSYNGGCGMQGQSVNSQSGEQTVSQTGIEEKIFKHAEENFSIRRQDYELKKITAGTLPPDIENFYLEKKGSYGNKFYNYLTYKENLYASEKKDDAGRLLKDYDFLSKKNLSAEQLLTIVQLLEINSKDGMVIDKDLMAHPYDSIKPFIQKISVPTLDFTSNGAKLKYFLFNSDVQEILSYEVIIYSDYNIKINSEELK